MEGGNAPAQPTQPSRPTKRPAWPRLLEFVVVASAFLILLTGLTDRFNLFLGSPLNGDLRGFVAGARDSAWFYDSGVREPLHCAFLKAALALPLEEERAIRLTTLLQMLLAAACIYWAGRRLLGPPWASVALWLFCINPVALYYGVGGLRGPLYTALIVLFVGLLSGLNLKRPIVAGLVLGFAGALLVLTRVYAFAFVAAGLSLVALELRAWRPERRRQVGLLLLTAALTTVVLWLPDTVLRPNTHVGTDVTRMRNFERRGVDTIQPGDPMITFSQYLFEDRTAGEIVGRTLSNYVLFIRKYLRHYLRGYEWAVWWLPLATLVACLRRRWLLATAWITSLAPIVFVLNLDLAGPGSGVETRVVMHALPLCLFVMLDSLGWTLKKAAGPLERATGRRLPKPLMGLLSPEPDSGQRARSSQR